MPDDSRHRKVVLCVNQWSSEEAIYAWYWVKSHLLRGSTQEFWTYTLYIVHASTHKGRERDPRWDSGGPTTPDLRTSVSGFPAQIVEVEGDPGNSIVDFVKREKVNLLILGSKVGTNIRRKVLGSTTEHVVRRVDCPCLIIKPKLAIGDTMRLKTVASLDNQQSSPSPPSHAASHTNKPSSPLHYSRRVAIMFDTLPNARFLFPWTLRHVLVPSDTIFVVRCAPSRRASGGGKSQPVQEFGRSVDALVAELLPGYNIATMYQLATSDVKHGAIRLVEEEGIDLLIAARAVGRTRRRACTAMQVVSHLYKNVGCPMLLVKLNTVGSQRGVPARPEDMVEDGLEMDDTASEEGDTDDDGVESAEEVEDASALLHSGAPCTPTLSRSATGGIRPIKTLPMEQARTTMNTHLHTESVASAVENLVQHLLASGHVQLHQPTSHFWVQVDPTGKVTGLVPLKVPPPENTIVDTPTSMGTTSLSVDVSLDSFASFLPLVHASAENPAEAGTGIGPSPLRSPSHALSPGLDDSSAGMASKSTMNNAVQGDGILTSVADLRSNAASK